MTFVSRSILSAVCTCLIFFVLLPSAILQASPDASPKVKAGCGCQAGLLRSFGMKPGVCSANSPSVIGSGIGTCNTVNCSYVQPAVYFGIPVLVGLSEFRSCTLAQCGSGASCAISVNATVNIPTVAQPQTTQVINIPGTCEVQNNVCGCRGNIQFQIGGQILADNCFVSTCSP